jgi:hypothetical protein
MTSRALFLRFYGFIHEYLRKSVVNKSQALYDRGFEVWNIMRLLTLFGDGYTDKIKPVCSEHVFIVLDESNKCKI